MNLRNPKVIIVIFLACFIASVLALALSGCAPRYEEAVNWGMSDLPVYEYVDDDQPICYIGAWEDYYQGRMYRESEWKHVTSIDETCSGWAWLP